MHRICPDIRKYINYTDLQLMGKFVKEFLQKILSKYFVSIFIVWRILLTLRVTDSLTIQFFRAAWLKGLKSIMHAIICQFYVRGFTGNFVHSVRDRE